MNRLLPVLVLLVVALAGCSGALSGDATPTPEATPEPTPTATATPTETVTATSTGTPDVSSLQQTPPETPTPAATATPTATQTPPETPTATATPTATSTPTQTPTPTPDPPAESDIEVSASEITHTDSAAVVTYEVTNTHEETARVTLDFSLVGEPEPNSLADREGRQTTIYDPIDIDNVVHSGDTWTETVEYDGERWQNVTDARWQIDVE